MSRWTRATPTEEGFYKFIEVNGLVGSLKEIDARIYWWYGKIGGELHAMLEAGEDHPVSQLTGYWRKWAELPYQQEAPK